jgi:hypothetical protein
VCAHPRPQDFLGLSDRVHDVSPYVTSSCGQALLACPDESRASPDFEVLRCATSRGVEGLAAGLNRTGGRPSPAPGMQEVESHASQNAACSSIPCVPISTS